MRVNLIAYTVMPGEADPAALVERAASTCYDSQPTKKFRIAKACAESGHMSVWEHISFTFEVDGVSRSLLAQLTRHRHGSYSVRSQRYCREDNFPAVDPFKKNEARHLIFAGAMMEAEHHYLSLIYNGAKPEDARSVLPNACATKMVVTFNGRALVEMSRLRLCMRAQDEIRHMVEAMREEVRAVCPVLAGMMRPACEADPEHPFCPEKRDGCGKHPKLSEVYNHG